MLYNQPKSQVDVQDHLAQKPAWKMTDDQLKTELTTLQGTNADLPFTVSGDEPSFTAAMAKGLYGKSFAQLDQTQKKVIINVDLRARKSGISTPKMHIGDSFTISVVSEKMMLGFKLNGATDMTDIELSNPKLAEVKATVDESRLNLVHLRRETVMGIAKKTHSIVAVMRALGYNPTMAGRREFLKKNIPCITAINIGADTDERIAPYNVDGTYIGTAKQNEAFVDWVVANYESLVDAGSGAAPSDRDDNSGNEKLAASTSGKEDADEATLSDSVDAESGSDSEEGDSDNDDNQESNSDGDSDDEPNTSPTPKESRETRQRESAFKREWQRFKRKELTDKAVTELLQSDLKGVTANVKIDKAESPSTGAATIILSHNGNSVDTKLIFSVDYQSPYDFVIMSSDPDSTTYENLSEALKSPLDSIKPIPYTPGQVREVTTANFDTMVKAYDGVSLVAFGKDNQELAKQFAASHENQNVNVVVLANPATIAEPFKTAWLDGNGAGFRFYEGGKWQGPIITTTNLDDLKKAAPEKAD